MYRNLLSSPARVQVPWIKVTLGEYTFGVFSKATLDKKITKLTIKHFIVFNILIM